MTLIMINVNVYVAYVLERTHFCVKVHVQSDCFYKNILTEKLFQSSVKNDYLFT